MSELLNKRVKTWTPEEELCQYELVMEADADSEDFSSMVIPNETGTSGDVLFGWLFFRICWFSFLASDVIVGLWWPFEFLFGLCPLFLSFADGELWLQSFSFAMNFLFIVFNQNTKLYPKI